MAKKSISIIVPIYNCEKYVEECLDSILSQSLSEKEIICVDDGSTDNTLMILKRYEIENEDILVFNQKHLGASAARNLGLRVAKGEYVIFMDSDDYYPDKYVLEKLYATAKKQNVKIVGGSIEYDIGGEIVERDDEHSSIFSSSSLHKYEDFQDCYYHPRYLFDKRMLIDNEIYYPDLLLYEDPVFLVRAMMQAGIFYTIKDFVYVYRVNRKTRKFNIENTRDFLIGLKSLFDIAYANNYIKLQKKLKEEIYSVRELFFWALLNNDKDIKNLIEDISSYDSCIFNFSAANNSFRIRQNFLKTCNEYNSILIYGAGNVSKIIIKFLKSNAVISIAGIAVSSNTKVELIDDIEVKNIDKYDLLPEKTLVLIATTKQEYVDEMIKNAYVNGYKNILLCKDLINSRAFFFCDSEEFYYV